MKKINRVNLAINTLDSITVFNSELTRWFEARGLNVEDNLIKINSNVPAGRNQSEEMDIVSAQLTHFCAEGYNFNNVVFKPFMVAASDSRKATSAWVNADHIADLWTWAMCGLTTADLNNKIAINKYMAYIGLLASASHPFSEVFGTPVDIRRVAVVKDGYVDVSGIMDVVNSDGTVDHDVDRVAHINAFDGFGIIRKDLTKGESVTIRGPWIKAFVQATDWTQLSVFCLKNSKKTFVDFWGNEVALKDVDVILSESCFKAVKLYESWDKYCSAFEKLGHRICVCVREHAPKLKGMPYQQGQTLLGDENDADMFALHAAVTVEKFSAPKEAASLLPRYHRNAAKLYPAMLKEGHTARTIQEKYTAKRLDMLGGRIPKLGYNAFIAPDMLAFVQHVFGLKVTGSLKAGECASLVSNSGVVDVTRNPHLDNAHVLLNNVGKMEFVSDTPTMFLNIFDLTTIRLRADYDGDHVWYSQNAMLIDLVNKTYGVIHNNPVDWNVESAPKSRINKATVAGFVSGLLKGSEIGLYADALTKMWNASYDRDVCDWLTYAGNVLIDAAKHATVRIDKPDAVKALDQGSLPEFCRFAKADAAHPADSKYWDEVKKSGAPRTAYSGSFMDMYSRKVSQNVPEILEIDGIEDEVFDVHKMLINPLRKIGKLAGLSKKSTNYNPDTGRYEDGGVFQQIAFRHAAEWKSIMNVDENSKMIFSEWEAAKAAEARKEMITWARAQYADDARISALDDEQIFTAIYDIVTRNVFSTKLVTEGYDTVVKSAYWRIFGEKAVQIIGENLGQSILDNFDPDDYDID